MGAPPEGDVVARQRGWIPAVVDEVEHTPLEPGYELGYAQINARGVQPGSTEAVHYVPWKGARRTIERQGASKYSNLVLTGTPAPEIVAAVSLGLFPPLKLYPSSVNPRPTIDDTSASKNQRFIANVQFGRLNRLSKESLTGLRLVYLSMIYRFVGSETVNSGLDAPDFGHGNTFSNVHVPNFPKGTYILQYLMTDVTLSGGEPNVDHSVAGKGFRQRTRLSASKWAIETEIRRLWARSPGDRLPVQNGEGEREWLAVLDDPLVNRLNNYTRFGIQPVKRSTKVWLRRTGSIVASSIDLDNSVAYPNDDSQYDTNQQIEGSFLIKGHPAWRPNPQMVIPHNGLYWDVDEVDASRNPGGAYEVAATAIVPRSTNAVQFN